MDANYPDGDQERAARTFGTVPDEMSGHDEPLRNRAVSGGLWIGVSRVIAFTLQVVVTIVLARLLRPEDFGLFAMTMILVNFSTVVVHAGLGDAIVQREHLTERHLSAAFWMNWVLGAMMSLFLFTIAPVVADYFSEPALVDLMRLVSVNYIIQVGAVPIALLARSLRFRAVAFVETSSLALGIIAAVVAAAAGLGAEALVLQVLATTLCFSISSAVLAKWLPRARPTWKAAKELWTFSGWIAAANVVGFWSENVDTLAIGRTSSAAEVGYYNRAFNLLGMPLSIFNNVSAQVAVPTLASIQSDTGRSHRVWLEGMLAVARLGFPTFVGMAAAAPALVNTIWGGEWASVVPFLQVLALAGIPWIISNACVWPLLARGLGRRYFLLKLANTLTTVVLVVLGLQWGAIGVAWAVLARTLIMLPIWMFGSLQNLGITPGAVMWEVRKPFVNSVVMGMCVFALGAVFSENGVLEFASQVLLGVAVYAGIASLIDRDALRLPSRRA